MWIKKLHLQYTRGQQLKFWRAKESWVCRASLLLEWCWLVAQEFVHMYKCGEGYMILLPYGLDSLICQLRSPKFKFKKTTWYYLSMIFFHAWCFCDLCVLCKIFNCSFHISLKIFSCEFFIMDWSLQIRFIFIWWNTYNFPLGKVNPNICMRVCPCILSNVTILVERNVKPFQAVIG